MTDQQQIEAYLQVKMPTVCPTPPYEGELHYRKAKITVRHDGEGTEPMDPTMKRLARLKIASAFMALMTYGKGAQWNTERFHAEIWFTRPDGDLSVWCEYAELAVGMVRRHARDIIRRKKLQLKTGRAWSLRKPEWMED